MNPKKRFIPRDDDLWQPPQIVTPNFSRDEEPEGYNQPEWADLIKPGLRTEPEAYTDSAAETGYTPPKKETAERPTDTPTPAPKAEYEPAAAGTPSAAEAAGKTPASYDDIVSRVRDNMQRYYDMLDGVGNMRWTGYDVEADELYKQYAAEYARGAEKAMKDAMGNAALMNGGYGSTYAQQVGQQTYQDYMAGLANKIPELYELAYRRFRDERGDALDLADRYRYGIDTEYDVMEKERAYNDKLATQNAGSYTYYDAKRFGDLGLGTEETYEIDDALADAIDRGNFSALSETLKKYGVTGTQAERIENYAQRMNGLSGEQTAEDYEYKYIDERLLGGKELSYAQKKQLDFDAYMYLMTGDISALQKDFTTFQMGSEALQALDDLKRQRMLVEQSAASSGASEKQSMSAADLDKWNGTRSKYAEKQKTSANTAAADQFADQIAAKIGEGYAIDVKNEVEYFLDEADGGEFGRDDLCKIILSDLIAYGVVSENEAVGLYNRIIGA